MKRPTAGLTLIELLVGLALIGIVLATLLSLTIGTARPSATLQARNDLLPELQTAQNYMAGKLREAVYIFPAGLSFSLAGSGNTLKSPSGSYNWTIGTDPMVAFIVPPRSVVSPTSTTLGGCASGSDNDKYCYAFYAFYAIKRADLVNPTGADSRTNNPGPDASNDANAWVLMEYRGYYTTSVLGYTASGYSTTLTNIPGATTNGGSSGRLLMDYLQPMTGTIPLFTAPSTGPQVAGQTNMKMNLAARQAAPGQIVRLPNNLLNTDPAAFNTLTVYPRNVGKPQLLN